jgi:formylmethanofuran dehydrogenase subunit E-like metal-binding protein
LGNNQDELFQGELNVTKPDPSWWSYEQFVQAVREGSVKSVFMVNRTPVRESSDTTAVVVQTSAGKTRFVDVPTDSNWTELLDECSVKLTSMEVGPDFDMRILKSLISAVAFLCGLLILLKAFGK